MGIIKFIVKDAKTSALLENVSIQLTSSTGAVSSGVTNSKGDVCFEVSEKATHLVTAQKPPYPDFTSTYKISGLDQEIILSANTAGWILSQHYTKTTPVCSSPPVTQPPTTGDTHLECRNGICTRVPGIGPDANCIEGQPCSSSNPPLPPGGNLPPLPVLGDPPPLDYSGFMPFIESVYNRIAWLFQYVFDSLAWIIFALGSLIPQLLAFIFYILSLQWLKDLLDQFFTRLDIWVSEKFGIDPALPFWEELVKKAIGWLSGGIDEAARKATERLK